MPQSDGKNTLKRMEFAFKGKSYKFNINPEEYTQDEPSRSTVTQTKGGAWVDDFGGGLVQIYLKGTTGMKNGFKKFKELRDMIRKYYKDIKAGNTVKDELIFHNFTDEESWVVHTDPAGFKLFRSKTNPLLFMYEIRLICLRPASQPKRSAEKTTFSRLSIDAAYQKTEFSKLNIKKISSLVKQHNDRVTVKELVMPTLSRTVGTVSNTGSTINQMSSTFMTYIGDLSIVADGTVQNLHLPPAEQPYEPSPVSVVSNKARNMLVDMNNNRSSFSSKAVPDNSIIKLFMDLDGTTPELPKEVKSLFKAVMLEVCGIYDAVSTDISELPEGVAETDIERLTDNISWITYKLTELPGSHVELLEGLRELELALNHILMDNEVY